jgi:DNA-binding ferritin-like protein
MKTQIGITGANRKEGANTLVKLFEDEPNDLGKSDFIIDPTEKHDKIAWSLRSHLN